jgi:hypothetical protein
MLFQFYGIIRESHRSTELHSFSFAGLFCVTVRKLRDFRIEKDRRRISVNNWLCVAVSSLTSWRSLSHSINAPPFVASGVFFTPCSQDGPRDFIQSQLNPVPVHVPCLFCWPVYINTVPSFTPVSWKCLFDDYDNDSDKSAGKLRVLQDRQLPLRTSVQLAVFTFLWWFTFAHFSVI